MAGNKGAGGPFAPLVVVTRNIMGTKEFNQFRGKMISLHSQGAQEGPWPPPPAELGAGAACAALRSLCVPHSALANASQRYSAAGAAAGVALAGRSRPQSPAAWRNMPLSLPPASVSPPLPDATCRPAPPAHAVIKDFCKQLGADTKQVQGLIRLAKKNGEKLGFLA